jgi:signal transduction histidine kinase
VSISLRYGEDSRVLVLEVHDDGPGFQPEDGSPGTGLQNMQDRLSAVGGELRIDTRPGGGTWVRAQAPIPADVLPLQPEADSRR